MTLRSALTLGLVAGCAAFASAQGIVYVNGATGDDAWDGRCEVWDGGTCGPKATIQAGIDVAVAGDEVLIADGVYMGTGNRDLDFGGRAITVRSASGDPAACIIDCEHVGRGFNFHGGETGAAVVRALTIRNGSATSGGGVYCTSASPTLIDCVLTTNVATASTALGGGMYFELSNAVLDNCTISENSAVGISPGTYAYAYGGGVYAQNSSLILTECRVTNNSASATTGGSGGGLEFENCANAVLRDCVIADNAAVPSIGGAAGLGGGLNCMYGAILTRCTIAGNAARKGGGIYCYESPGPALTSCLITGNTATEYGGGMACVMYANATLANCTFAGNSGGLGGAIACRYDANPLVTNCILWYDGPQEIGIVEGTAVPVVQYSDVEGGWAGAGNLASPPQFRDIGSHDCRLMGSSPCVDAGDPSFMAAPCEVDLDRHMRVWDGDDDGVPRIDMGAYEFASHAYGDLDCDGLINAFDIDPFVLALTDPAGYALCYPECDAILADLNCDGIVNVFDIDPFVLCLTGGGRVRP